MDNFNSEKEKIYYVPPKKKKSGGTLIIIIALICSIFGGVIGGAIVYVAKTPQTPAYEAQSEQVIKINNSSEVGLVEAVAKKALPSVVGVTTLQTKDSYVGPVQAQGTGSGVVIDARGYILTNSHVVNNGNIEQSTVLLNSGNSVQGKVIWADAQLDLAVVKIETTEKLQVAELGDSDTIQVGEVAVAIGNPLSLDFQKSVTAGVISGLNRKIGQVEGNYMDGLIQTDASINRGNSGGPLLNGKGQVIGLNTVKIAAQGAEGLGFSIPINTIKPIIEDVITKGNYQRVVLGITGGNVEDVQKDLNYKLKVKSGVIVADVYPQSSAYMAGIKPYDIIVKIGDAKINTMNDLKRALIKFKVGDTTTINLIRDDKEQEINMTFNDYDGKI